MINIFNPKLIMLTGGISKIGGLLLDPVRRTVQSRVLEVAGRGVEINISGMDDYAGARGAAMLVMDNFFQFQKKVRYKK